MQINGYAQAFREPDLVRAVQSGAHHRIVVTFVMWSDYERQYQAVPWTVIADGTSALQFADAIVHGLAPTSGWTSISGAIRYSAALFASAPAAAERRVIDISGDGSNNDGPPPAEARDAAVAQGITINGLPILEVEPELDRVLPRGGDRRTDRVSDRRPRPREFRDGGATQASRGSCRNGQDLHGGIE